MKTPARKKKSDARRAAAIGGGSLAVIHLGANAVSLLIGERRADGRVAPLEVLSQPVPLARDVFATARIDAEAIERAVSVLGVFRQAMREHGLDAPARIVTTNLLLEARNQDTLVNRIQVAHGWRTEVLDDGEMTRLIYLNIRRLLRRQKNLADQPTLVSHLGPGNTRALFFHEGGISDYRSYRLGLERSRAQVEQSRGDLALSARMIDQHARSVVDQICYDYLGPGVKQLVTLGVEIQQVGALLGRPHGAAIHVPLKKLAALIGGIEADGSDRIARQLQLDYRTADLLLFTLQHHLSLAEALGLEEILIPHGDFEESLLADLLSSAAGVENFRSEVVQAALNLGRRFAIDDDHARQVAALSARLFHELRDLHQLGPREELILHVAALLHETGHHISSREHHKHSMYVIAHNEVFGLSQEDTLLAALVARYHRRALPSTLHPDYAGLDRDQRLIVSKLAALLRVADALDRGRGQRLEISRVSREGAQLLVDLGRVKDTSVEQLALNAKGDLFTSVFGLEVVLQSHTS